jgi:hypothetical protein
VRHHVPPAPATATASEDWLLVTCELVKKAPAPAGPKLDAIDDIPF